MTRRRELKEQAQDALMHAMSTVWYRLSDEDASLELREETRRQFERVEKMFGYELGSWKS